MALKYNCTICNRAIGYEGLCWKCKAEKERNEALNLTEEQIRERQKYLVEHLQELGKRDNPADKYFWDCLSYHDIISEELQRAAVKEKIFYPAEIYYHAPEDVRDELISYLMATDDSGEASCLLCCLAMQGDDKSLDVLYELKKYPRLWRNDLYVDSDVYAQQGGWTFDSEGTRQLINYSKCYSLEKKNTGDKAVVVGKIRSDKCQHCGGKLVDILSLDGKDKRLDFLGIKGKIIATCCPDCVAYTDTAFSRFSLEGVSEAIFPYEGAEELISLFKEKGVGDGNTFREEDYDDLASNGLELSREERPVFYGADDWEATTIGGFAHWIQDCIITKCPDCGKPMRYLGQLAWESIMENGGEGTVYIEICPDCKIVSMQHQQT